MTGSIGWALAVGLAVDLATTPDLASVEHPLAVVIGIAGALLLPDRWPRSLDRPVEAPCPPEHPTVTSGGSRRLIGASACRPG
jgi:hypothetical protein